MSRKTRKLMWSVPLIAAVAVIGALAAFMTLTPNGVLAQAEEVPGMPTNFTGKALGPDSIELMWDAPAAGMGGAPDGYRIDYSDDGKVWYSLEPNHNSTVFTDDTDLMAVQTRHYRVFAFNSGGSSAVLNGMSVTTMKSTKAGPPSNLTAQNGTPPQEQIDLAWNAPDNPTGAPVTAYLIEVSKDGRNFTKLKQDSAKAMKCNSDNSCAYTHKGLLEMQQRWYRVTAMNHPNGKDAAAVSSNASGTASHTTAAGIIPGAPQNVRVGLNPGGRMTLYWDAPMDDTTTNDADESDPDGAPVIGYYVWGTASGAGYTASVPAATDQPASAIAVSKLFFIEANTGLVLTPSVLGRFGTPPDFAGADDGLYFDGNTATLTTDNLGWDFQVLAVNSVVRRLLSDGEWDVPVPAGTPPVNDGVWSAPSLPVDNRQDKTRGFPVGTTDVPVTDTTDPDDNREDPAVTTDDTSDDLLNRPNLTVKRLNNVDAGRTSVQLDWTVEKIRDDTEGTEGLQNTVKQYRIERSEDRIDWEHIEQTSAVGLTRTYTDTGRTAGTMYFYRVFAEHNKRLGVTAPDSATDEIKIWTEASLPASVTTAPAGMPDPPLSFAVLAVSETQIDLSWAAPGMEGEEAVGYGKVVGYEIEVSDDGKTFSPLKTVEADKTSYSHEGLVQGQTKYYRVSTVNNAPRSAKRSVPTAVLKDTTYSSLASDNPGGLIAKATSHSTIELVWNARADDITAAPIIGYKIESSPLNAAGDDCAEDWSVLMADTMSTDTSYTHSGLMAETGVCYRVFGINVVATSSGFVGYGDEYVTTNDNDAIAKTHAAVAPSMPQSVMATANSDTQITVSWMAPADTGGMDVTGYVLQRKSGDGDFMTIAATNAATWWDTLNCEMMNAAIADDATPAPPADHTSMDSPYCKMYDGLMDDAKMVVNATFMANYGTITGMSYVDMDLMANTKYYYRVIALNSVGKSDPSDGMAYAMTQMTPVTNNDPRAVGSIDAVMVTVGMSSDAMDVSKYFSDADADDTLTYTAMSSNDAVAMANIPDGSSMLTISGVTEGSATVTVTASDGMGGTNATQTIMVTVNPVALVAPTITGTNPVGSGIVLVSWDSVTNAAGYTLIAVNLSDRSAPTRTAAADADHTSGQIQNLKVGDEYLVFVGAFDSDLEYKLSDYVKFTAE